MVRMINAGINYGYEYLGNSQSAGDHASVRQVLPHAHGCAATST